LDETAWRRSVKRLPIEFWRRSAMTLRSLAVSLAVAAALGLTGGAQDKDKSATSPTTTSGAPSTSTRGTEAAKATPSAESKGSARAKRKTEKATFGAGCFWHVEDVFEHVKGVKSAVSGYAGGNVPYPSYEMVHTGQTGHAEVVQVEFDPQIIGYEQLLKVFWACHDPTSINRQGEDEGPQYRSVIFFHNVDQKDAALKSYEELTRAGVYPRPIVTQLVPMGRFYRAEGYHQDYYGGKPRAATRRSRRLATGTADAKRKAVRAARNGKSPAGPQPPALAPTPGAEPASGRDPHR
jgi:peptide-methionine (S)-S-oxide reductase